MHSTIIQNGLKSAIFLVAIFGLPLLFTGVPEPGDFMSSEIVGHIFILLSLVFVFLGMKQYREANGGTLSYWRAVYTGLLIAIFPAIAFGLYNILYVEVIDPEFMVKYSENIITERSVGKTAEEISAIRQTVMDEQQMFGNPAVMFLVMFLSVIVMGLIVSLISAFFVKKN